MDTSPSTLPNTEAEWQSAPLAASGHFDEFRGRIAGSGVAASLAPAWQTFIGHLDAHSPQDLNQRRDNLQRLIRDNGVTYNVYADADGPQRPWSLDLFPMLLEAADWAQIEAGVRQRAQLLEAIMADVYGAQRLTRQALLPEALVRGHPGYLRPLHGMAPALNSHLQIAAFDLARSPEGRWWVVSQRTQAPSGLGYLLENRNSISLQFPQAFQAMGVRSLAGSYKALIDGMRSACPVLDGGPKRIVLLTPGPFNETYFEHAYLARYLGLTLVEGSDLLVRGDRLYLKTIGGLEPVHGVLKRMDDEFLDPLELRADSTLGVPGLLQVLRAGHVLIANTPGSAFLESPALLGFLPALSQELLGQPLQLPSLATWWCGEQAAMQAMLPQLNDCVIKPSTRHGDSVIARDLNRKRQDEWAGRIMRAGEDYTVQAYMPLSQTPIWHQGEMAMRSALLRVFALSDGRGAWHVLPGALARLAGRSQNIASMQQGGSSADVWVLGSAGAPGKPDAVAPAARAPVSPMSAISSRSAENLFWLGRYTERAENAVRLAQLTLQSLNGEDQNSPSLLTWLSQVALANALVSPGVPPASQSRRVFERALIASLADPKQAASVGFTLLALKNAAASVRERLSQGQWQTIVQAEQDFRQRCAVSGSQQRDLPGPGYSVSETLRTLEATSQVLAAITGAQSDRMMRDDGWRLLTLGRHIERLGNLASALARGLATVAVHESGGYRALLALFDSTITFQSRYQQRRDLSALLDLLVLDPDNPRSLAWVVQQLLGQARQLGAAAQESDLATALDEPTLWALAAQAPLAESSAAAELVEALHALAQRAWALSEQLGRRHFSHAVENRSVGA